MRLAKGQTLANNALPICSPKRGNLTFRRVAIAIYTIWHADVCIDQGPAVSPPPGPLRNGLPHFRTPTA